MRALHFKVYALTQVMQKTRALCKSYVLAHLRRDDAAQLRHLNGVVEHVLTVACSVFKSAQQFNNLRVKTVNARFKHSALAFFFNSDIQLALHFFPRFLQYVRDGCARQI